MNYFPDAKESFFKILAYCRANGIHVKVLCSVRIPSVREGKIQWCKNRLLLDEKDIIIVKQAAQKADYAAADALLIDDNEENIKSFISRGGYGFKFSIWNEETFNAILKLIKTVHQRGFNYAKQ